MIYVLSMFMQLFMCEDTALISDLDRHFLDLWGATSQPDVTSVLRVRHVQSVERYLNPTGSSGSVCNGFWCSVNVWRRD
jgi:hypothetical protein